MIAVRLAVFFAAYGGNVPHAEDSITYEEPALSLMSGAGYAIAGRPTAVNPPVYPLYIAGIYALTGDSRSAVVLSQAILGAVTAVLLFGIARNWLPTGWSAAAAGVGALHPDVVLWSNYVVTETLALVLSTAAIACALRARTHGARWAAVATGLASLAALARPMLAFLVPAIVLWWTVSAGGGLRRMAVRAALLSLVAAAVFLPWTLRNAVELGTPYPLSSKGGIAMLWSVSWHEGIASADEFYPPEVADMDEVQADGYLRTYALRQIGSDPIHFAWLGVRKIIETWRPTYSHFSLRHQVADVILWVGLVPAAIAYALRPSWWRDRGAIALLLTVLAGANVVIALTTTDPEFRYRMPMIPLVALVAMSTYRTVTASRASRASLDQRA